MKTVSAGLILTDGNSFLGCHSTGHWYYDLPKGTVEENEEHIDTCIREVYEETGLIVSKTDLIDLGIFNHSEVKNLHLFLKITRDLPHIKDLYCNSFFQDKNGVEKPEHCGFKYIPFTQKYLYASANMQRTLKKVQIIMILKEDYLRSIGHDLYNGFKNDPCLYTAIQEYLTKKISTMDIEEIKKILEELNL